MAKNKMKLNYKRPKRERNKNIIEVNEKDEAQSFFINLAIVLGFVGLLYLGVLGLEKLGLFEEGYTKPISTAVTISDTEILMGSVFNRPDKTYYVLFDEINSDTKKDPYVEYLLSKVTDTKVYKVDMELKYNEKYISTKSNPQAKKASDLKISDITLIKITNGKIAKYIVGSDEIVEYLN